MYVKLARTISSPCFASSLSKNEFKTFAVNVGVGAGREKLVRFAKKVVATRCNRWGVCDTPVAKNFSCSSVHFREFWMSNFSTNSKHSFPFPFPFPPTPTKPNSTFISSFSPIILRSPPWQSPPELQLTITLTPFPKYFGSQAHSI